MSSFTIGLYGKAVAAGHQSTVSPHLRYEFRRVFGGSWRVIVLRWKLLITLREKDYPHLQILVYLQHHVMGAHALNMASDSDFVKAGALAASIANTSSSYIATRHGLQSSLSPLPSSPKPVFTTHWMVRFVAPSASILVK